MALSAEGLQTTNQRGQLNIRDIPDGAEAWAYAKIGTKIYQLFYIKTLSATAEKVKSELKVLGSKFVQHKASGINGTGTMSMYYTTSVWRRLMERYANEGIDTYFDIVIEQSDPGTSIGKQQISLHNCNIDSVNVVNIDVDADYLDEDMDFTFDGFTILSDYTQPDIGIYGYTDYEVTDFLDEIENINNYQNATQNSGATPPTNI